MNPPSPNLLNVMLSDAISQAAEPIIRKAVEDFEAEVRRKVALAVMDVSRFYEVEPMRDRIVITVKTA